MTLISAVMPTRGRREYAALAVQNFLSQTWPDKELIILDDADKPSFVTSPECLSSNIRYMVADRRYNIAEKRNMVCAAARGEFIIHFDSDDWSAPGRMAHQMEVLDREKKDVCGFRRMYFWQVDKKQPWIYSGTADYVLGTSLIFRRSFWAHNHWNVKFKIGSDNIFIARAVREKQLASSSSTDFMVSRNHSDNTNTRRYGVNWRKVDRALLPAAFFDMEESANERKTTSADLQETR